MEEGWGRTVKEGERVMSEGGFEGRVEWTCQKARESKDLSKKERTCQKKNYIVIYRQLCQKKGMQYVFFFF
jgi:hypothetical protein